MIRGEKCIVRDSFKVVLVLGSFHARCHKWIVKHCMIYIVGLGVMLRF